MNSTQFNQFAIAKLNEVIAQNDVLADLETQVRIIAPQPKHFLTPQRKARYNDKTRIRRKDAKEWALRRSGCNSTTEIKKYLKILGKKLDLRLTSAWVAVNKEFADFIKQLKLAETFSIGDKVEWTGYRPIDAHICAWFPLVITAIKDGKAQLDIWANPVPLDELVAV